MAAAAVSVDACCVSHLFQLAHGQREERDELLLVLADAHAGDLRQALQSHISEHGHVQELKAGEADVQRLHSVPSVIHAPRLHTLYTSVLISLVSKMYPRGIQLRNRSRVSSVAWTRGAFWEFS